MSELKPCPFCGEESVSFSEHAIDAYTNYGWGSVSCPNCDADGPYQSTRAEAAAAWNRRAQPAAQALPAITEQQSKWGRLYTAANALVVQMGYHGSMQADSTEMESLKDKLHDLDGGEWMPGLTPPAQPAAPAFTWPAKSCPCGSVMSSECAATDCKWQTDPSLVPESKRIYAAPSVAPEGSPAARFNRLMDELGIRFPDPEPYSAQAPEGRVLKAIDALRLEYFKAVTPSVAPEPPEAVLNAAKEFVANGYRGPLNQAKLVFDYVAALPTANPPRAPLTPTQIKAALCDGVTDPVFMRLTDAQLVALARVVEAAHGIGGK